MSCSTGTCGINRGGGPAPAHVAARFGWLERLNPHSPHSYYRNTGYRNIGKILSEGGTEVTGPNPGEAGGLSPEDLAKTERGGVGPGGTPGPVAGAAAPAASTNAFDVARAGLAALAQFGSAMSQADVDRARISAQAASDAAARADRAAYGSPGGMPPLSSQQNVVAGMGAPSSGIQTIQPAAAASPWTWLLALGAGVLLIMTRGGKKALF